MSKNQNSNDQELENQRIIKEWMERNNSSRIIIGPNSTGVNSESKTKNGSEPFPVIVSITKKDDKNENSRRFTLLPKKKSNIKRNSTEPNVTQRKLARWSTPVVSIKIEPANTPAGSTIEKKESCSDTDTSTSMKQVRKLVQSSECLKDKLIAQNYLKRSLPTISGIKNGKNHIINRKNIKKPLLADEQDVYSTVQHNYKCLSIPKHWSVAEFENDLYKQCIAFSKARVISENGTLITVVQKSMIIDKGGTIHYSVHGLPVNVKGTILPDALDSVKKLLSIIHIFDKMQVCNGVGDDILKVKTDSLLKDNCHVWRHADCKLVLVKVDQCLICLDTKNSILEKEMLFKSEQLAMPTVDTTIKEEPN